MSEHSDDVCGSSISNVSSHQDTEDEISIGHILAEANHKSERSLGKRLSHLSSVPHAPRVNGQIPDVDNTTLDHQRVLERLQTYGLSELQVEGDGNCQFLALPDQLFRNPDCHKHVRKAVIKQGSHQPRGDNVNPIKRCSDKDAQKKTLALLGLHFIPPHKITKDLC